MGIRKTSRAWRHSTAEEFQLEFSPSAISEGKVGRERQLKTSCFKKNSNSWESFLYWCWHPISPFLKNIFGALCLAPSHENSSIICRDFFFLKTSYLILIPSPPPEANIQYSPLQIHHALASYCLSHTKLAPFQKYRISLYTWWFYTAD